MDSAASFRGTWPGPCNYLGLEIAVNSGAMGCWQPKGNSVQDCLTHNNFFQVRFRRLLLLLLPSLELIFRDRDSGRLSLIPLDSKPDCLREGRTALKASSGAK